MLSQRSLWNASITCKTKAMDIISEVYENRVLRCTLSTSINGHETIARQHGVVFVIPAISNSSVNRRSLSLLSFWVSNWTKGI